MAESTKDRSDRRRVLDMLEEGKIDVDHATRLLHLLSIDVEPHAAGERDRILGLLEEGVLKADQAVMLLGSLAPRRRPPTPPSGPGAAAHVAAVHTARTAASERKGITRMLRITIDACEEGEKDVKVRVNVPLGLARFAGRFLPNDAREQLADQGIDLTELLEQLGDDLPEGPLIDIDAAAGSTDAKILIEVV